MIITKSMMALAIKPHFPNHANDQLLDIAAQVVGTLYNQKTNMRVHDLFKSTPNITFRDGSKKPPTLSQANNMMFQVYESGYQISMILNSRQSGGTLSLAFILVHYAMKHPGSRLRYVVPSGFSIKMMIERIQEITNQLFDQTVSITRKDKITDVGFSNGSVLVAHQAVVTPAVTARYTEATDFLVLDDAFNISFSYPLVGELFQEDTRVIVNGTPGVNQGPLYDLWTHNPDIHKVQIPWQMGYGERDDEWAVYQKLSLGSEIFGNQYECKFIIK